MQKINVKMNVEHQPLIDSLNDLLSQKQKDGQAYFTIRQCLDTENWDESSQIAIRLQCASDYMPAEELEAFYEEVNPLLKQLSTKLQATLLLRGFSILHADGCNLIAIHAQRHDTLNVHFTDSNVLFTFTYSGQY